MHLIFHRLPCVTLRDEKEWAELAKFGANVVVGTDSTETAALWCTTISKQLNPIFMAMITQRTS